MNYEIDTSRTWIYWLAGIFAMLMTIPSLLVTEKLVNHFFEEIIIVSPAGDILPWLKALPELDNKQNQSDFSNIIDPITVTFELIRPMSDVLCATNNPWSLGEKIIQHDCFAIRLSINKNANIMIISKDSDDTLYKILPHSCENLQSLDTLEANKKLIIPTNTDHSPAVFAIDDSSGDEWFYAMAFESTLSIKSLVSEIPDICSNTENKTRDISITEILTTMKENNPNRFDWKSFRFFH